jgi:hypothetical protein
VWRDFTVDTAAENHVPHLHTHASSGGDVHQGLCRVSRRHSHHATDAARSSVAGHDDGCTAGGTGTSFQRWVDENGSLVERLEVSASGISIVAYRLCDILGEVREKLPNKLTSSVHASDSVGRASQHEGPAGDEVGEHPPPGLQNLKVVCASDAEALLVESLAQRDAVFLGVLLQVPDRERE